MKMDRVDKVRMWRMCSGCGACASACPENNIVMQDVTSRGLRPFLKSQQCRFCGTCVQVCPGVSLAHPKDNSFKGSEWGPVLKVWEGYAADENIRYKGSSGGAATALAHYCLEYEQASGVLQIRADEADPLRNRTVLSRSYEELAASTGSRYSPASPCERFEWILKAERPCVFVGKPCDVAALAKYADVFPAIKKKVLVSISIFCAGTPSTDGTFEILKQMGVNARDVESFRYRGNGWPGKAVAQSTLKEKAGELTYTESWGGILSKHVAFRCKLCPDSSGEFGDISCGDPWYRPIEPRDPGRSLVIARTRRGQDVIERAIAAGYLVLEPSEKPIISQSQKSLLNKRRNVWARVGTLRVMGIPAPQYRGFGLLRSWWKLGLKAQVKSIAGTVKRIVFRKLYLPDAEESGS